MPAPPTDREIEILRRILEGAEFDGASQLRDQVRMLQVTPESSATCRIYLLHPDAPRASMALQGRTRIPGTYRVQWLDGALLGDIGVWVENGHLRALHYVGLTERVPLTLPPPDWIRCNEEAPPTPAIPPSSPVGAAAAEQPSALRDALRTHARATVVLAACVLAILATAVALGRSSGADVAAATRAGQQVGQRLGAADGATLGAFRGMTEGELAGSGSTYRQAFDGARSRVRAEARQQRRREAARAAAAAEAAAAAAAPPTTVCPGYTDSRGVYICTA